MQKVIIWVTAQIKNQNQNKNKPHQTKQIKQQPQKCGKKTLKEGKNSFLQERIPKVEFQYQM